MNLAALIVVLLATATITYVLFGYPLLLALIARYKNRPVYRKPYLTTVTIILPVRNGEAYVKTKLQNLLALDYPRNLLQIIVVSDGSTDKTDEILQHYAESGQVEFFRIPPSGKPSAINTALKAARGEILFFTDVRQELDPESLRYLIENFADRHVGVVSGELVIREGSNAEETSTSLYWKYEKWIRKNLSRIDSILGATGCIYAARAHLVKPLPPNCLLDDVYIPLLAFFQGYRVILDERARAFDWPTRTDIEFRRKVRTQAGVIQLLRYFPQLLSLKNRMLFHFISHKLGRLLLPYCLMAIAIASFYLPKPLGFVSLSLQTTFYFLAAVDFLIPHTSPLRTITAPPRTFLALVVAALLAISVFFVPPEKLWQPTRLTPKEAGSK